MRAGCTGVTRYGWGLALGACVAAGASLWSCAEDSPEGTLTCASLPLECPPVVPSYAGEIAPIIATHCGNCHMRSDPTGPWPFDDRQDVADWSLAIQSDIEDCLMPPPDTDAPLADADRQKLHAWLVCGAPDN